MSDEYCAEDEDLDEDIDPADELRELGKTYETRSSQYDHFFSKKPVEFTDIQQLYALITKSDAAKSIKDALTFSALTTDFLQNLIEYGEQSKSAPAEDREKIDAVIAFTILARINAAIASGNPVALDSCFTQLNQAIDNNPSLAKILREYKSANGEMLEDVLMKVNLEKCIATLKRDPAISSLETQDQKTKAVLKRMQSMRDFSLKLKLGKEQREKYFQQVYNRIQAIHIEQYGEQGKLEAARKSILEATIGTYAAMFSQDGCLTDEWYERYMREIIAGQIGKKSQKSKLLSVKSSEDSVVSGGEYEQHLVETNRKLQSSLARNRAEGIIAGKGVPALSVASGEMPTSIMKGSGGHYAITMRGGRGKNSAPFIIAQGNYGDITMAADPLFGFAIANKKEAPTDKRDPNNPIQKWLVTRAEIQAKTGPRFKVIRQQFADSSSLKEWLNEATLTIAMGSAIALMHRIKKSPKPSAVPQGPSDKFANILSETRYIKAYTLQRFISGEELAASIKDDNAKLDLAVYEKWLQTKKNEPEYARKLAIYLAANSEKRSAMLLADAEYKATMKLQEDDEIVLQAVARYEAWIRDKEDSTKLIDFASRSPFSRLLKILGDKEYKTYLERRKTSPQLIADLITIVEKNLALRLTEAVSVAKALADFHATGYVHGDVKGRNIMKNAGGHRLIDFGTSGRMLPNGKSKNAIDTFMGMTANFIPPEAVTKDVAQGKRMFNPTVASDVYQMAAVCFNYSNTKAFAKVNMERFICNPTLMGFISGTGKGLYLEYLDKDRTQHPAHQQACKQAYIDFVTEKIQITPKLNKNNYIEWVDSPKIADHIAKEFLEKLLDLFVKTTRREPDILATNSNIKAYIGQVQTRASLISKRGDRDNLIPTINTGTIIGRSIRDEPILIKEENIAGVVASIELDADVLPGYTRTPASDDEGSGFELYDTIKLFASLDPMKYGELFARIKTLMKSSLAKEPTERISSKQFHTEMAGIASRLEILQNPGGPLGQLDAKRKVIEQILTNIEEAVEEDRSIIVQELLEVLTNENLFKELLENILDDSEADQFFVSRILQNLLAADKQPIDAATPILQMLGAENPDDNIFLTLINRDNIKLAEKLLDFAVPVNLSVWQGIISAAAGNGAFDLILKLQEQRQDIEWETIILEKISAGNNSVLDFCLAQNNLAAFKGFLPSIVHRMSVDDQYFKELLCKISLNANDSSFIDAVRAQTGLDEHDFINQFFPKLAENGMSCLAQFFLYDVSFASKIIANLNPDNTEEFFKIQDDVQAERKEATATKMSTAMLAFIGNNTTIMQKVFDFAVLHRKIEKLTYTRVDGVTVTFLDHILANNNAEMFNYVVGKLQDEPQILFDLLTKDKSSNNCMLGLITSTDAALADENQAIFAESVATLAAITNKIGNEEQRKEFYLKVLGARAFAKALSLGKLEIVHALAAEYEKLGITDKVFSKLFGLDDKGNVNPEFAKLKKYFLNLQPFNLLLQEGRTKDLKLIRKLFAVAKTAQDNTCMDEVVSSLTKGNPSFFLQEQDYESSEILYDFLTATEVSPDSVNSILLHTCEGESSFIENLLNRPLQIINQQINERKMAEISASTSAREKELARAIEALKVAKSSLTARKNSAVEKNEEFDAAEEEAIRLKRVFDDYSEKGSAIVRPEIKRQYKNAYDTAIEIAVNAKEKKIKADEAVATAERKLKEAFEHIEQAEQALQAEHARATEKLATIEASVIPAQDSLRLGDLIAAVGKDSVTPKKPATITSLYEKLINAGKPMEALVLLLEVLKFAHQSPEYAAFHNQWLQKKLQHTIAELIANKADYEAIYGDGAIDDMFQAVFTIYEASNTACDDPAPWQELASGTLDLNALNQQLADARSFVGKVSKQISKIEGVADNGFISEVQAWQQDLLELNIDGKTLATITDEETAKIKHKIMHILPIQESVVTIEELMKANFDTASIIEIVRNIHSEKAKLMAAHAGAEIFKIFNEIANADAGYNFDAAIQRYANNHNQHTSNVILHTTADDPLRGIMFAEMQGLPYPAEVIADLTLLQQKFIDLVEEKINKFL